MKIVQLIEARQASGGPRYKNLSNEKVIQQFFDKDEEMSRDESGDHYNPKETVQVWDKRKDMLFDWLVVYPPGGTTNIVNGQREPNRDIVYFAISHDQNKDWRTDPQRWQISHLQVLFDG